MDFKLRRVVTGHNAEGKAVVQIDETVSNVISARPGQCSTVIWTTDSAPADNDVSEDMSRRAVGTSETNGSVFRVVRYDPGVSPRMHRTDSIDYAVVLSGEIDMNMDAGSVHLKAGDVLVQRGTIHNWVNNGTQPCIIAFSLIGAHPVTAGNKKLDAVG
jgi:hypothetical protein